MKLRQLKALGRPITIEDIRLPHGKGKTGFQYVGFHPNWKGKRYQAQYNKGGGSNPDRPRWTGKRRATAEEAAADFVAWFNGEPIIRTSTSSGRPDFYKDKHGQMFVDLPPETTKTPARGAKTKKSTEREFILRMYDAVDSLMGPNDIAEAKAGIARQQIVTAVGQLQLKQFEQGNGRMFIVLPDTPDETIQKFLRHKNITLVVEKKEVQS